MSLRTYLPPPFHSSFDPSVTACMGRPHLRRVSAALKARAPCRHVRRGACAARWAGVLGQLATLLLTGHRPRPRFPSECATDAPDAPRHLYTCSGGCYRSPSSSSCPASAVTRGQRSRFRSAEARSASRTSRGAASTGATASRHNLTWRNWARGSDCRVRVGRGFHGGWPGLGLGRGCRWVGSGGSHVCESGRGEGRAETGGSNVEGRWKHNAATACSVRALLQARLKSRRSLERRSTRV